MHKFVLAHTEAYFEHCVTTDVEHHAPHGKQGLRVHVGHQVVAKDLLFKKKKKIVFTYLNVTAMRFECVEIK